MRASYINVIYFKFVFLVIIGLKRLVTNILIDYNDTLYHMIIPFLACSYFGLNQIPLEPFQEINPKSLPKFVTIIPVSVPLDPCEFVPVDTSMVSPSTS